MPLYKKQISDDTYGAGWNGLTHIGASKNAIYDKIETLSSGSAEATTKAISQASHGFAVGDVLKYSGSVYAKAQANSASNAEVVGIVSVVAGANDFTLLTEGYISTLSGLTANTTYFLSASSAGALTSTEPSTAGQVSKPLLRAVSSSAGYFVNMRGVVVPSASGDGWTLISYSSASAASSITVSSVDSETDKNWRVIIKASGDNNVRNFNLTYNTNTASYVYGGTYNYFNGSSWSAGNTSSTSASAIQLNGQGTFKSILAILDISTVNVDGVNPKPIISFQSTSSGNGTSNDALCSFVGCGNYTGFVGDETTISELLVTSSSNNCDWEVWILKPNTS